MHRSNEYHTFPRNVWKISRNSKRDDEKYADEVDILQRRRIITVYNPRNQRRRHYSIER